MWRVAVAVWWASRECRGGCAPLLLEAPPLNLTPAAAPVAFRPPAPLLRAFNASTWTPPLWDCDAGRWVAGLAAAYNTRLYFPLQLVQCGDSLTLISPGGECANLAAQCEATDKSGSLFTCSCSPGFVSATQPWQLTMAEVRDALVGANLTLGSCAPCADGCKAEVDRLLRTAVLGVQLLCMALTVVLAAVVFRQRKCRTIATGMWTILETILLGIFLLYATVVVRFFDPSKEQCLIEPWFRELGFVICYGAIILKLYRILIEFRTRKAHRWVVRDKDLLKYLLGMVLVVLGYMSAWTATNLNFLQESYSILTQATTSQGYHFPACKPLWWDYVTQTGELLILVFGLHLSYACRNAKTQFQERRFLCLAIGVEAAVSGAFYVLRVPYGTALHPDLSFIAYFARSQLTNTAVLALIFMPKLWYQHKQVRDARNYLSHEFSARSPLDAFKPHDAVNSSEVDVGEINLADMNPDDIRAELKRLYTQLEVLKNKTIRADNPHISKRRGGRKVAHRRFSLQKKGSREKALHHRQQRSSTRHPPPEPEPTEAEVSRTPEDSVCSNEGPSAIYDSEFGTPNVSGRHRP